MAYQFSRKGCFKCGNLGHIAETCSSDQRLCYNCRQPGHESSACPSPRSVSARQCYSCGGVGHIQAECPSLRIQQQAAGQKCYNCGRFGHIARACPSGALGGPGFAPRPAPPGRGLNMGALPPVKCYKCGGPNHMAKDCLATIDTGIPTGPASMKNKTCYRCHQEGHVCLDDPIFTSYTRQELYNVVADVGSYQHFIPFCSASRVLSTTDETKIPILMDAELTVQFLAFKESYVSRVTCVPLQSVQAVASSSTPLFKELKTTWRFGNPLESERPPPTVNSSKLPLTSSTTTPTLVELDLAFAFASPLHAAVSSSFFGQVSRLMVQAFEDRCASVYGRR
ncbi:dehydrase and lipid transport-domain-containing protein [Favolaschia claudopus]|uniref:Dehydrase and lipid transport-domain-containing protein n=1 Tax=Favolaschia claudopus TaxID=2862362 RepID=A0AAW0EBB1_9AGAR